MRRGFWKERSAAECADQNCVFCKELNIKRSSVDVAPTPGVNHVYLVLWWFFYVVFVMFYAFDK